MKGCISCAETKPLTDFYKHPSSSDWRAGVCKDCHKRRMKTRRRANPAVQEYERARAKEPHRRARAKKLVANWREKFPDKYSALTALGNAVRDRKIKRGRACVDCGSTKNVFGIHPDYRKPTKVVWRRALCHHRSRFATSAAAVPAGTTVIVIDTFNQHLGEA